MTGAAAVAVRGRDLAAMMAAAEAAWPEECCGLLIGNGRETITVGRVLPAANIAADRRAAFEVDPAVRLRLERELRARGGGTRLVGHYHSHPNGAAAPSPTDAARAGWEPDLLWLVVAVDAHGARPPRAWRFDPDRRAFHSVPLHPI